MHRRSRLQPITLSGEEQSQLRNWSRSKRRVGPALALRARIVLQCRQGCSNREVARRLGVTAQTVCKWRERWSSRRLASELGISQRAILRIWHAFDVQA